MTTVSAYPPSRLAWVAAGRPHPPAAGHRDDPRPAPTRDGTCMVCGHVGDVHPAGKIVSELYMDAPDCRWKGVDWALCSPCAWAHRHRPYRTVPWVLDGVHGTCVQATPPDLFAALERFGPWSCVVVPVSRQVHVLPKAGWGQVCTDRDFAPWGPDDTARLYTLRDLRALGFGEAALAEAEPRWDVLRRCDDRRHVLDLWHRLDPWRRQRPSLVDVAVRATRTPKDADKELDDAPDR